MIYLVMFNLCMNFFHKMILFDILSVAYNKLKVHLNVFLLKMFLVKIFSREVFLKESLIKYLFKKH